MGYRNEFGEFNVFAVLVLGEKGRKVFAVHREQYLNFTSKQIIN